MSSRKEVYFGASQELLDSIPGDESLNLAQLQAQFNQYEKLLAEAIGNKDKFKINLIEAKLKTIQARMEELRGQAGFEEMLNQETQDQTNKKLMD